MGLQGHYSEYEPESTTETVEVLEYEGDKLIKKTVTTTTRTHIRKRQPSWSGPYYGGTHTTSGNTTHYVPKHAGETLF